MTDDKHDTREIPSLAFRTATVEAERFALRAEGDDRIPIAISSEQPVERNDWWEGDKGRYVEVLDHSADAVDLGYAGRGLPFLADHDHTQHVGRVEDITLGADKRLRGMVRFSKSARGQEIKQDFQDGIRTEISVGYRKSDYTVDGEREGVPVRRYKWMPMEASSVAVPADITVGVGRAHSAPAANILTATMAKEHTMSDKDTAAHAADEAAIVARVRVEAEQSERARAADITALAEKAGIESGRASAWINEGKSVDAVLREVNAVLAERLSKPIQTATGYEGISAREQRTFSVARAILGAAGDKVDDGYEREVQQELAKTLPSGYKAKGGVLIPMRTNPNGELAVRAGLDSATSTKGSELKFTEPGDFIALLRNRMQVKALGARFLDGLTGPVTFPKQAGAGTASWVSENPGSDVADSNLTLGTVTLSPKTLQSSTSFSRQLLVIAQSANVAAEQIVREDLAQIHALALDLAALNGSGSSGQPLGVAGTTGIGSEAIGTNGGAIAYTNAVNMESTLAAANADQLGSMAYLAHPVIRGNLKGKQIFPATSNGAPIWSGGMEGEVNGYRAVVSAQVPSLQTKGASTDCYYFYLGIWSELMIGSWNAFELVVDPYRLKKQGMIEITSFQMADVAIRHPAAFVVCKDARNV